MNIDKKLNQALNDPQKRSDVNQDIEKALHPFSQMIKTLKDSTLNQIILLLIQLL
jgi:hypothetical protein